MKTLVMNFSKCLRFLALNKLKLATQLENLIHIYILLIKNKNYFILNASQKLVESEEFKLVKLILTAPSTNAVSESSCSTLCRVKSYLRLSITQERLNSSYL